ncbi:MAG TPA: TetR/AcrR family transcriptional regulator [Solirubrobacteraceae bacterium]|nr:TetR/AcrR family transcriptional regulator [Solirubrobacteraceae bacterium]
MSRQVNKTAADRTFIEEARRAQLVACAIETIAELGYGQASLARIAERAGISKGVIGYHFAGKDELLSEVVGEVMARAEDYIRPRVSAESTGPAVLRAYIEASLAFMAEHRNHVLALVEIGRNSRPGDGGPSLGPRFVEASIGSLAKLLASFQGTHELRSDFDPMVVATAIRAAIDSVPRRLADHHELDVAHYGRELADLFDLATRKEQHVQDHGPERRSDQ